MEGIVLFSRFVLEGNISSTAYIASVYFIFVLCLKFSLKLYFVLEGIVLFSRCNLSEGNISSAAFY